jgi:hypothetical protein
MHDLAQQLARIRMMEALAENTSIPGERQAALSFVEQLKARLPGNTPASFKTALDAEGAFMSGNPGTAHRTMMSITAPDEWTGRLLVALAEAQGLSHHIEGPRTIVLWEDDPALDTFVQELARLSREFDERLGETALEFIEEKLGV